MTLRFSGRIFILLVVSLHSPCFLAKQQSNPPQQNASASKAAGVTMLSDTEGVDFKSYLRDVYISVKKRWFVNMPATVQLGQQGQNSVQFRILKDGTISDDSVKLVLTSGKKDLDAASLRAIRQAGPFGNLPEQFSKPFIELRFTFYYNVSPSNPQ